MYLIQKNNIQQAWKTFSVEIKRRYRVIFEDRPIEEIISDFYLRRWISKAELLKLHRFQYNELLGRLERALQDYNDLTKSFSLRCMENFDEGMLKQLLDQKKAQI